MTQPTILDRYSDQYTHDCERALGLRNRPGPSRVIVAAANLDDKRQRETARACRRASRYICLNSPALPRLTGSTSQLPRK